MQQVKIQFYSAEQVRQFVNMIDQFDADFDLDSGQRSVNAKAILGVMALDLSRPLHLRYHSADVATEEKIAPFLCSRG